MILTLRCRFCREIYAQVDTGNISSDLSADMFAATDLHAPSPFGVAEGPEHFRCPFGPIDAHWGHNPLMDPETGELITDRLLLDNMQEWEIGSSMAELIQKATPQGMRQVEIDAQWASQEADFPDNPPKHGTSTQNSPLNVGKPIYYCRVCGDTFPHRSSRIRHERKEHGYDVTAHGDQKDQVNSGVG